MTGAAHPLLGKWRITSMELWDAAFIDLLGPGYIRFDEDGGGEIVFGAVQGEIDGLPSTESIHFTWEGSDEMDHASGDGDAKLEADGSRTAKPSMMADFNGSPSNHAVSAFSTRSKRSSSGIRTVPRWDNG